MTIISKKKSWSTYVAVTLASVFLLFTFSSCTRKIAFQTSSVVPAARGDVRIVKDKNKNYRIKVRLSNLAEVERLQNHQISYVVWMVSESNVVKNIGQIRSASSMLSSKLQASFETVSNVRPVRIYITAEEDGNVQYSQAPIVLTTNDF